MNTQHLQYMIEIERARSISQAAENLFIGQPNLSRILHDLEASLGFSIFERTSRGVRPTERGARFLQHAHGVLREMEMIEALGPRHTVPNRLRICLPRSTRLFEIATQYLATLGTPEGMNVVIRECHARKALDLISGGEAELGVIRFRSEYQDYFEEQTAKNELNFQLMRKLKYNVVMPKDHPLSAADSVTAEQLADYPEIAHDDIQRLRCQGVTNHRRIYTVDRLAQFQLLQTVWGAYMLSEPQPERCLKNFGLIQKPCSGSSTLYLDAIIYNPRYAMAGIESGFVQYMIRENQK